MEKLAASKIIHADDDFVKEIHEKLKVLKDQEDDGLKEYDSYQASFYCNVTAQTIRNHIKNYVRGNEGRKLKAVKRGLGYVILKKDLDQYKLNPKQILNDN